MSRRLFQALASLIFLSSVAFGQGIIIPDDCHRCPPRPPIPRPHPLPRVLKVKSINISTKIDSQVATTRVEQVFLWFYVGSDHPDIPGFRPLLVVVSVAVVVLEYALAFGMPFRSARRYLVWLGLAFHAVIYITLPVFTFSATMVLLYLAYFDADAVDRVIGRLQGSQPPRQPT